MNNFTITGKVSVLKATGLKHKGNLSLAALHNQIQDEKSCFITS